MVAAPLLSVLGLGAWVTYATVRGVHAEVLLGRARLALPDAVLLALRLRGLRPGAPHSAGSCRTGRHPVRGDSLPFLLLFRLTCYYYRKAYYRVFWLSPPACAVPDGHKTYSGETRFPLIFQNSHRYAFYAAVLISLVNT